MLATGGVGVAEDPWVRWDWISRHLDVIGAALIQHIELTVIADRKSTRLNSSHLVISYAVFCFKKKRLLGIGWQGSRDRQMLENCENDFVGGSERSFHTGAAELQQRIVFVKVPNQAGADGDGALEALVRRRLSRFQTGGFFRGQMRIENQQDAAVIFAREFADHQ